MLCPEPELQSLLQKLIPRTAPWGRAMLRHIMQQDTRRSFLVIPADEQRVAGGLNYHGDTMQIGMPRMKHVPRHLDRRRSAVPIEGHDQVARDILRGVPFDHVAVDEVNYLSV
jgi:hypothetical protein